MFLARSNWAIELVAAVAKLFKSFTSLEVKFSSLIRFNSAWAASIWSSKAFLRSCVSFEYRSSFLSAFAWLIAVFNSPTLVFNFFAASTIWLALA
nr:hypothetical protein [Mycoplasmopsis pullorum]